MTNLNKLLNPLFLKEKEIRKLIELLFFSYRDFTSYSDVILDKIKFGRIHYRIIYFVGKKKEITIKDLLQILKIKKQNLSRSLHQLVKLKYIKVKIGIDKRSKTLSLTKKGVSLEKELSSVQIKKIKNILINANENDIYGFKKILHAMIDSEGKKIFGKLN